VTRFRGRLNAAGFVFIVIDVSGPPQYSLGKVLHHGVYRAVLRHLSEQDSWWCKAPRRAVRRDSFGASPPPLKHRRAELQTIPDTVYVPSFGAMVVSVLAGAPRYTPPTRSLPDSRFVQCGWLPAAFQLRKDMAPLPMPAQSLTDRCLSTYGGTDWKESGIWKLGRRKFLGPLAVRKIVGLSAQEYILPPIEQND